MKRLFRLAARLWATRTTPAASFRRRVAIIWPTTTYHCWPYSSLRGSIREDRPVDLSWANVIRQITTWHAEARMDEAGPGWAEAAKVLAPPGPVDPEGSR